MADNVLPPVASRFQKIHLQVLFFLRFIQLGSTVMTGYIFCYLVWFHNNHYCALYPYDCSTFQRTVVKVPWAEILMVLTCSATFLESYVSSALSLLSGQGQPNNTYLLISTLPITVLYAISYRYFYKIPNVAGECWYNQNQSIRANVELKYCAMVTNVKFSAAIALAATALIFIMSTAMVVHQKLQKKKNLSTNTPAVTEEMTTVEVVPGTIV